MSPAWIRPRDVTKSTRNPRGRSYQVLFRRGGRLHRIESAGTFKTQTEARTRRDLVAGWLAAGLNPKDELGKLAAATVEIRTPLEVRDDWLASRHQLAESTKHIYRNGTDAALTLLGVRDLQAITVADCERLVGLLAADYTVATVTTYWQAFAQLLDYAAVEPNPARNRRVKLPREKRKPPTVPTADHVAVMLRRIAAKYVLPMVLIEQTAVRVETIDTLAWGNIDIAGAQLRITEKGRKIRWVPLPRWLMRQLEETCPLEDRLADRRVFPGVTSSGLRGAMSKACRLGKIPHYHPHDLRHRRASLWHLQGIPDAVLAERVGHERPSFTKDVYTHVMPVAEIPDERLEAIVAEARA